MSESNSYDWSGQHVEQIARLAHIHLSDAELESTSQQLHGLLEHVSQLNQVEIPVAIDSFPGMNQSESWLRNDQPFPSLDRNAMLKNAPETDGQFYLVPQRATQE